MPSFEYDCVPNGTTGNVATGESIAISADFENHSSRTIVPYATLHQSQTFFANGKSRLRGSKFTVLTGLPVAPGNRATWDSQLLKIPAVSPSIVNCSVIKVDYYVKVALHIPGAYNLSMHLPVVIGTVPYRRLSPRVLRAGQIFTDSLMEYFGPQPQPAPPPYRESATPPPPIDSPPNYADSMTGPVDIRDDDDQDIEGDLLFTPMYTYVYDYRPPPVYNEVDPFPGQSTMVSSSCL